MEYDLAIKKENIACHLDIEKDIQEKKNGLFTFTIRVHNGNIVDYNVTEYINVREKYTGLAKVIMAKSFIAFDYRK